MRNDLERTIPELCSYLHVASFLGLVLVCFTRTYTGRSRWGKVDLSPLLNAVWQPDTVCQTPRLLNTVWHTLRLADTVWQTASRRICQTPDPVCQMPRLIEAVCQTLRLVDAIWQTAIWQLADGVSQRLPDTRRQTPSARNRIWQTIWLTASARRHLPDATSARRHLPDSRLSARRGVWQTWHQPDGQLVDATSGRHRLPDTVC